MDIQELNKSQLILLAVLLSFITSIVTGITTVTLMQQAPVSVTTPINRVIQQTVEKIQQVEGKTTVQTVVVKEEDLVVDALSKNKNALFSVTKDSDYGTELPSGDGFIISQDGVVAVDANWVPRRDVYYLSNASGKFKAEFMFTDQNGVSFLKIDAPVDGTSVPVYSVPTFGDVNKLKIGQKVIMYGNGVSSFIFDGNKDMKVIGAKSNPGGMILNLDGEVLGMALSGDSQSFVSVSAITDAFNIGKAR